MKLIIFKYIEIFTDGTIHFFYTSLKSSKQVVFYEKDGKNSLFFRKPTKNQPLQNLSRSYYRSRYKL
jgi:hypothetical protein